MVHVHPVQIYYEDTDLSGVVYHANYLKYFERAREHLIGPAELVRLLDEEGIGFVVYHVEMTFKEARAWATPSRCGPLWRSRAAGAPSSPRRSGAPGGPLRRWRGWCTWCAWGRTRSWCSSRLACWSGWGCEARPQWRVWRVGETLWRFWGVVRWAMSRCRSLATLLSRDVREGATASGLRRLASWARSRFSSR